MIDTDFLYFIAFYSPGDKSVTFDDFKKFNDKMTAKGFQLIDGYAYPFDKPENLIQNKEEQNQLMNKWIPESNGKSRGKVLTYWRFPFEFTLSLQKEEDYGFEIHLKVELDTFRGIKNQWLKENSNSLVEVIRILMSCIPAVFACGFVEEDSPLPEEVLQTETEIIYPINYYGTTYVNKYQKNILLKAPAWLVEETGNGVLLIPSIEAFNGLGGDQMDLIRTHLGVSKDTEIY